MSEKIEQFLYTHCTYGTSFIERRDGESAVRTLGYGPRASSIEKAGLRLLCLKVEPLLYLDPPRGTPGELKLELDARTGPRRLVYVPERNGCQSVFLVSYRNQDTSGRPASYFAHVLVSDLSSSGGSWDPIDCLRLWPTSSAVGWTWTVEDDESLDFSMASLEALPALGNGDIPAAVSDDVLASFLTNEAPDEFDDAGGLIPEAWRVRPAADRQRLMTTVLAEVTRAVENDVTLLLIADESFAVLLFYGIFRLFPGKGCFGKPLSFSTYEADPNRLRTTLAATHVHPGSDPITAKSIQGGHRIVDTFAESPVEQDMGEDGYGAFIVRQVVDGGFEAVERCFGELGETNSTPTALEAMAVAGQAAIRVFDGETPQQDAPWRSNDDAWKFHCRCVASHLYRSGCWKEDGWQAGSDMHLYAVTTVCDNRLDRNKTDRQIAKQLLDQLVECPGSDARQTFLRTSNVAVELRAYLATQIIDTLLGQPTADGPFVLPAELKFLAEVEPKQLRGGLLVQVLSGLHNLETEDNPNRLASFFGAVPPDLRVGVLAAIGCALGQAKSGPILEATKAVLDQVDDDELFALYRSEFADAALRGWPGDDAELYTRTNSLWENIDWRKTRFIHDFDALNSFANKADYRPLKVKVKAWIELLNDLKYLGSVPQKKLAFKEFGRLRDRLRLEGVLDWEDEDIHSTRKEVQQLGEFAHRVATDRGEEWAEPHNWSQTILPALVTVGYDWKVENSWLRFQKTAYGRWFQNEYQKESQHIEKNIAYIIRTSARKRRATPGKPPGDSALTTGAVKKVVMGLSAVVAVGLMWLAVSTVLDSPSQTDGDSVSDSTAEKNSNRLGGSGSTTPEPEKDSATPPVSDRGSSRTGGDVKPAVVGATKNGDGQVPRGEQKAPATGGETAGASGQTDRGKPAATEAGSKQKDSAGSMTVTPIKPKLVRLGTTMTIKLQAVPVTFEILHVDTGTTPQKRWRAVDGANNKQKTVQERTEEGTPLYDVNLKVDELTVAVSSDAAAEKNGQPLIVFVVVCHGKSGGGSNSEAVMFATGRWPKKTLHQLENGKGSSELPEVVSGVKKSELVVKATHIGDPKEGLQNLNDERKNDQEPMSFLVKWVGNAFLGKDPFHLIFEVESDKKTLTSKIDKSSFAKATTQARDSLNQCIEHKHALSKLLTTLNGHIILRMENKKTLIYRIWYNKDPYLWKPTIKNNSYYLDLLIKRGIHGTGGRRGRYRPNNEDSPYASAIQLQKLLGDELVKVENELKRAKRTIDNSNFLIKNVKQILGGVVVGHLEWQTKSKDGRYEFVVKVLEFPKEIKEGT